MDEFLQIESISGTQGADDNVRANTSFEGQVSLRVGKSVIGRIVQNGPADLVAGCFDKTRHRIAIRPVCRNKNQQMDQYEK
jgi:hypothetical protein